MGRIVVVGGLNTDIHLFGLRSSAGQAPLIADHHVTQPGGKGANVSRAVARLGAEVTLVGRVGDDELGRDCVAAVAADGVDTGGVVVTDGASTGFVAIELDRGKHRSIVFSPGANDLLSWSDVEPQVGGLGPDDLLIAQAEVPAATLSRLCADAVERAIPLFLDPTPPDRVLRDHVPTLDVEVLDETGAGDVFLAALAVQRLDGVDWDAAVRFANAASAISVSQVGLALPDRELVMRRRAELDAPSEVVLTG